MIQTATDTANLVEYALAGNPKVAVEMKLNTGTALRQLRIGTAGEPHPPPSDCGQCVSTQVAVSVAVLDLHLVTSVPRYWPRAEALKQPGMNGGSLMLSVESAVAPSDPLTAPLSCAVIVLLAAMTGLLSSG